MGNTAPSDVPLARRWSKRNISTSAGTTRIPPPTPNIPESKPAPTPMATTRPMEYSELAVVMKLF
ncbi:unannotated protein [freshwater metagenome]|uniref:Unannotated protein n=1 Tax=freshwater metagenome TaxID=449393 RepID=A0A6J6DN19_9ZZZZ